MRVRARLVSELQSAMRLTRAVNDIIADDVCIGPGSMGRPGYRDALRQLHRCPITSAPDAFDQMLKSLATMPWSTRRDGIRICLWQYCKILPIMTMAQLEDFCDLYDKDSRLVSSWTVSLIGFVCGIAVGSALLVL